MMLIADVIQKAATGPYMSLDLAGKQSTQDIHVYWEEQTLKLFAL